MKRPVLIGIAGGTGSGKTSVAREITRNISPENILLIEQDNYYKDQSQLTMAQRVLTNYDHPNAFDNDLLLVHLNQLLDGQAIEKPIYNFAEHTRATITDRLEPKQVIILEGILVLEDERLRNLMDIKIFVDTDADVRIIRRVLRDIKERGRSIESVVEQYMGVVRPMHMQFIEPTKKYADLIIPEGGKNQVAIDVLVAKVNEIVTSMI
ncbi:uridine kinase [Tumebacillus permanentifrigoris]|uniref:Uridine kinase n=1 Tax=Tumebacillus permanentifrigoris TaxID=378543 RepID=A0A316D4U2_9BACL|nr:uridine kinase [Tumebacillus permanentifrigoris]PWK05094.1 uridine kinase [Tumebacillus permanentifrigoris]